MTLDWDSIVTYALSLPGTEAGTHYGLPAVKANGHALINAGRETGSFVLHVSADTKEMLMETDPATYWQTSHYQDWPAVLVRYDSRDPARILAMIDAALKGANGRKPPVPSRRRAKR